MILKTRHYIYTIVTATLVSVAVWLCMPKEYSATTTIIDEYKEMDLGIGINDIQATIKRALKQDNSGINDIEVYCKILKTEDFARKLSNKKLKDGITYGKHVICTKHWWQSGKDTIGIISDKINYNLRTKKAMLTIELKDSDPSIAALMLDSLVNELQCFINKSHQKKTSAALAEAQNKYELAKKEYNAAQSAYINYADSNSNAQDQFKITKAKELKKNLQAKYDTYQEVLERCIREDALLKREHYSFTTVKAIVVPNSDNKSLLGYIIVFITIASFIFFVLNEYFKNCKSGIKFSFGSLSAPWSITVIVWGAILVLSQFRDPDLLNPIGQQFYTSLTLWLLFFLSTSFIIYNVLPHERENNPNATSSITLSPINRIVFTGLLALSVTMTPLYIKKIYDVVLMFGTENFMTNVREYAVHGDLQLGVLVYSNLINTVLLIVAVWAYPNIKKWQLIWACLGCLLNAIAIMEKGGILLVFFCIVFVLFEKRVIKLRTITVLVVLALVFFYGFNLLRAEEDSDYQQNETIFGFIAMYILSPPVAYCELNTDIGTHFGANSLPFLYYYINKLGLGTFAIMERLHEFVYVPVCTNVYTVFQPYYQDFGQAGVAYFGAINGIICGLLYRYKQNGNDFAKCLYLYFAYVLFLQFFQEYIFTSAYFVPRMAILTFLCTQKNFRFTLHKQSSVRDAQQDTIK